MRRALDATKSKLASLTDRDAILDCFFEYAHHFFQFGVLFIVRGDMAHGRNVFGVGAPRGLVSRLAFSLNEPGVLSRARELRRPFLMTSTMGDVDARLFGSLGRAMPVGLVVPLIVRDRVVAIMLVDGPSDAVARRAVEAGRPAIELTKEEMLLWSEAVSEALERLIIRLKATTGSIPPPRSSENPPPLPAPARVPSFAPSLSPRMPTDDGAQVPGTPGRDVPVHAAADDQYLTQPPESLAAERPLPWLFISVAAALMVAAGGFLIWLTRPVDSDSVVLAGTNLPGWPSAVDPAAALEQARKLSGLPGTPELATIRAEVGKSGRVDFNVIPANLDGVFLRYAFLTADEESEVRIDSGGVRAPRRQARAVCEGHPCRVAVPVPQCTAAQAWEAAKPAGILDSDRAVVTYGDGRDRDGNGTAGPTWLVSVAGRGRVRVDAATCRALPDQLLMPPAVPLASLPAAPNVDPSALIPLARAQSGLGPDAVLLEIDARGVGSDGRVDLSTGESGITYTFADPPPPAGKAVRWREVKAGQDGFPVSSDEGDRAPLPGRFFHVLTPSPMCSFRHAYKTAGLTPATVKARITYGPDIVSTRSGLWTIDAPGQGVRTSLGDSECAAWENLDKAKQ